MNRRILRSLHVGVVYEDIGTIKYPNGQVRPLMCMKLNDVPASNWRRLKWHTKQHEERSAKRKAESPDIKVFHVDEYE